MQGAKKATAKAFWLATLVCTTAAFPQASGTQQTDIRIGTVASISSKVFEQPREHRVLLPSSYETKTQRYPVIYVLDGDSYFLAAYSAATSLAGAGAMPEAIVVAVTSADRRSEMTPPYMRMDGVARSSADRFLDYLVNELCPHIDKLYRTVPLRILVGHSHGGLFSVYALTQRPDVFHWHLVIDAPMHLDDHVLERRAEQALQKPTSRRPRLATTWQRFGWSAERWAAIRDNKAVVATTFEVEDESHSSMYYLSFYKGLKALFQDYPYPQGRNWNYAELDQRYTALTADYGYEVKIPKVVLTSGAIEQLAAAELEEARAFVNRLELDYRTSQVLRDDARKWLESLESDPPAENRRSYLAKSNASPKQVGDFLGRWTDGGKYELEITLNNDDVRAQLIQHFPGGGELTNDVEKVVALSDGSLEISYSNGMTPRSMIIIHRLSTIDTDQLAMEQRLLVYWPTMAGKVSNERVTLKKML